jgi:hypothetical protein
MFSLLLDALEKSLKHTSGENLCSTLYRGTLINRIRCLVCNTIRDREEDYFDLMTQVGASSNGMQAHM